MAGLGRKVWAADEVLAAADLQGYIQDQTVMVFNDASARTAGILSPTQGMVTLLKSDNLLYTHNGTTWVTASVGTAANALKVSGQTVFIQSATPTANATNDLWFW